MPQDRESVNIMFTGNEGPLTGAINKVVGSLSSFSGALTVAAAGVGFLAFNRIQPAIEEAEKFEVQVAELAKLLGEDLAAPLSQSISDLGNEMPVARDELFNVAETAARLGVRGNKNITDFTETMAKMGVATDISSEVAADAMARIAKQTQLPIDQLSNLGSAINFLSNTMATSFSEVVENMRRSAPTLARLGLAPEKIAALGASLNEVSESSRRAGTRLRRIGQALADPDKVSGFARALNMTTGEFQKLLEQDAEEAIMRIIRAFARNEEAAAVLARTMDSRVRQALAGLSQNLPTLEEKMDAVTGAFQDNISLQEEYERFIDTTISAQQALANQIDDLQVKVGQDMLGLKRDVLKIAGDIVEGLAVSFSDPLERQLGEAFTGVQRSINQMLFGEMFGTGESMADRIALNFEDTGRKVVRFFEAGVRGALRTAGFNVSDQMFFESFTSLDRQFKFFVRNQFNALVNEAPRLGRVFLNAFSTFMENANLQDLTMEETQNRVGEIRAIIGTLANELESSGMSAEVFRHEISEATELLGEPGGITKFRLRLEQLEERMARTPKEAENMGDGVADAVDPFGDINFEEQFERVFGLMREFADEDAGVEALDKFKEKILENARAFVRLRREKARTDEELSADQEARLDRARKILKEFPGGDAAIQFLEDLTTKVEDPLGLADTNIEILRTLNILEDYQEHQEELQDRTEEREETIEDIWEDLRRERDQITENEAATLRRRLAEENITGELRDRMLTYHRETKALEDAKEAAEERREEMERLQDRINNLTFATLEARLDLLVQTIQDMSGAFLDFVENVVSGSESAGDAILQMIKRVVRGIIESKLQGLLLKLFTGLLTKGAGEAAQSNVGIADFAGGDVQFAAKGASARPGELFVVGEEGPEFFVPDTAGKITPRLRKVGAGGGGQTTVVNKVDFNIRALDARSVQQLLENQGAPAIQRVMMKSAQRSSRFRSSIGGR